MSTVIPGYRISSFIAEGLRGPVYQAIRRVDGQGVAVQLLDLPDLGSRRRFVIQSTPLTRFPDHPHVVPVLDVGMAADGRPFRATPLADHSLGDRLTSSGALARSEVAAAGVAAATGLAGLHRAGMTHRNITPANLLVTANGLVAVTGMLVPVLDALDPSRLYRPPEVCAGDPWSVSGDVHALAATLWKLHTGQLPGPDEDSDDGPLTNALRAALSLDPADRPGSAEAFAATLRDCVSARPGSRTWHDTVPPRRVVRSSQPQAVGSLYVREEMLGHGAAGTVWRGRRRHDGASVAIKILYSALTSDPQAVERFIRERATLLRLDHPHLVRVTDTVMEGPTLAIVMDFVEGPDLRRAMADQPGPAWSCRVLAQVTYALDAIHRAGVIHRDLKPENVLIEQAGDASVARITDFGIARIAGVSTLTGASQLVGTAEYMAPEQIAGRPATAAADIYALGVMAYELLAGERPFSAPHHDGLLLACIEREPTRPQGFPEQAWHLVHACLDKEPSRRPTAADVSARFSVLAEFYEGQERTTVSGASDAGTAPEPVQNEAVEESMPQQPADIPPGNDGWTQRGGPRLALIISIMAAVGLAVGVTLVAAREPGAPGPPENQAPTAVNVRVDAHSPKPGEVVLRLSGGESIDGFRGYVVWRGDRILNRGDATDRDSYVVRFLDPQAEHCFTVAVAVDTSAGAPTPPKPEPVCLRADGRSSSSGVYRSHGG